MASDRCYVYAIVDRSATLPHNLTGIKGEPLTLVSYRKLAAVISATSESRVQPRAALLVRHAAVIETICQIMRALPVRFGTVLPDAAAVNQSLAERYDTLLADLNRVGDKQEVGVTIFWESAEDSPDTNGAPHREHMANPSSAEVEGRGTRYLLKRREVYQQDQAERDQAQAIIAELDSNLGPLVYESRYSLRTTPRVSVHAAYLAYPEGLTQVRNALASYQATHHNTHRLIITGPWPPYSFVSASRGLIHMARNAEE